MSSESFSINGVEIHTPKDSPEIIDKAKVKKEEDEVMDSLDPMDGLSFIDNEAKQDKKLTPIKFKKVVKDESEEEEMEEEEEHEEEEEEVKKPPPKKTVSKRKAETKKVIDDEASEEKPKKRGGKKSEATNKKKTKANANSTPHVSEAFRQKIGTVKELPETIDGEQINYFASNVGYSEESKPEKMDAIPEKTLLKIGHWRKVNSKFGDSYILYPVDSKKTYWSNSRVSGILSSGLVDEKTQVLTISRLAGGYFAYGAANKKH